MYRVEDYIILKSETRKEMKEKVLQFAEKGFVPQGGICITQEIISEHTTKLSTVFYQAISKTIKA